MRFPDDGAHGKSERADRSGRPHGCQRPGGAAGRARPFAMGLEPVAAPWLDHRHDPGSTRRLTLGADKGYDPQSSLPTCDKLASRRTSPKPGPSFRDRRAHHPAQRLCAVAQAPQADRRGFWLGQDHRRERADRIPRHRARPVALHPDAGGRKPRQTAQIAGRMRGAGRVKLRTTARHLCPSGRRMPHMREYRSQSGTKSAAC